MNSNESVFLTKITEKIRQGEYDRFLTIPFMTRQLLIDTIAARLARRVAKGMTPILLDSDVMLCVGEVKYTAVEVFATFMKNGFIERTEDGYEVTDKARLALKQCAITNLMER